MTSHMTSSTDPMCIPTSRRHPLDPEQSDPVVEHTGEHANWFIAGILQAR